ncbi:Transcriptional regulator, RpiR family [Leucobacter sp. 7(1)]|nr:Transcriptional regulator, RpiR family [Leucobacter sp. 7(1)]
MITPPLGGTRALLQSLAPSLVPSERRVAEVCIEDPEFAAAASVAALARRAEVSPATVVRACQKLGFDGLPRLRDCLRRDLGAAAVRRTVGLDATPEVPGGAAGAPAEHPVAHVFTRAMAGIQGALGALDLDAFDAAAGAIRESKRLLIIGNGASLPSAQSVSLHFLSSGKVCECPVDIVTQHIAAKLLGPGDVCLAVSDSGMNAFTLRSARLATENGATVIAITSYAKSELAQIADYALVAGADFHFWNDSTVTGNIVQVLLLSALHAAAIAHTPGAERAQAATFDEVRSMIADTSDGASDGTSDGTEAIRRGGT